MLDRLYSELALVPETHWKSFYVCSLLQMLFHVLQRPAVDYKISSKAFSVANSG